jgi:hypothetical protein
MSRVTGLRTFHSRAAERSIEAHRRRPMRNDDPRAIVVMIGFFAAMLITGMSLMWALTPTRHSEAIIGHDYPATSVPADQATALRLH